MHYPRIVAYARRRVRTFDDADEVVSATFLVAWRRIDEYLGADEPLAWLYGVARRTVLSYRRNQDRDRRLTDKAASAHDGTNIGGSPEASVLAEDELARVVAAATTLSEGDQEILRLVAWEDLSRAEAAAVLGISRVTARVRLLRARRRLSAACEAAFIELDET